MMNNYTPETFLVKLSGHTFESENALINYFESITPAIFEIDESRVVREIRSTALDGLHSKRADLWIFANVNRQQVLVAFEFKLDKSVTNYSKDGYGAARKQLHNYCQLSKIPYGILLSDKICEIYKYTFNGSVFNPEKILCLPSLIEIEKGLSVKKKWNYWQGFKSLFVISSVITSILFIILYIFLSINLKPENCTLVKGNVSLKQDGSIEEKIYHIPGSKYYEITKLKSSDNDRCFRTEQAAIKAGFRKPKN